VRFLGFGNYGVPLLDRIMSDLSIEEGHSITSSDRFSKGFTPSQVSSFVRVERAGQLKPSDGLVNLLMNRWFCSMRLFKLFLRPH
jgi:hypothetical protein